MYKPHVIIVGNNPALLKTVVAALVSRGVKSSASPYKFEEVNDAIDHHGAETAVGINTVSGGLDQNRAFGSSIYFYDCRFPEAPRFDLTAEPITRWLAFLDEPEPEQVKSLGQVAYEASPSGGQQNWGKWELAPQIVREVHEEMAKAVKAEVLKRGAK